MHRKDSLTNESPTLKTFGSPRKSISDHTVTHILNTSETHTHMIRPSLEVGKNISDSLNSPKTTKSSKIAMESLSNSKFLP